MNNSTRFIGLDDSKDAIQVAIAEDGRQGEVREFGAIPNTPEALRILVRRLGWPKDLNFVYEAASQKCLVASRLWLHSARKARRASRELA